MGSTIVFVGAGYRGSCYTNLGCGDWYATATRMQWQSDTS